MSFDSGAKAGLALDGGQAIEKRNLPARPDLRVRPLKALGTSVALSILFLGIYGGSNWIASQRTHVPTLFFSWERYIPFVPLMIVPYMSIDLFFVAAPFFCRSERELRLLTKRLLFALFVAGACFLVFPLRFAFERPDAAGWLGTVFNAFRSLDQPYNLLPSLHIGNLMVLAEVYFRRTRGVVRVAVEVWFVLIALSTVLTYQHHILDVFAGFILGACCLFLFSESGTGLTLMRNNRLGGYYTAGALLALAVAIGLWPWTSLLLWPAASLAIVAAGYFWLGPEIFLKTDGRLPWSTRVLLGPYLLGQQLCCLYYRAQCRDYDEVVPGLLIGRKLNDSDARSLVQSGVCAALDLTAEFSEAQLFLRANYLNIPVLDLTAPTQAQLIQASDFIQTNLRTGKVYVHCKIGYSRSAAAVGAYLLASGQARNVSEVLTTLRCARPSIIVRPEIIDALKDFVHNRFEQPPQSTVSSLAYADAP